MKTKTLLITALFFVGFFAYAQSGALKLVEEYKGKEGFVTISISKSLFKMLSKVESNDPDYKKVKDFSNKLSVFKILVSESGDRTFKNKLNNIANSLEGKGYEELLSVQDGKSSVVNISVLEKADRIQELVLTVVGNEKDDESVLMIIGGDFTLDEIVDVADDVEIDGLQEVKKAKKKG